MKYVELSSGHQMPVVGLGTWRAQASEIEAAVKSALDDGYKHIDTAFNYNTEEPIGKMVNDWISSGKGKRENIFVTTKLPNVGNRPSDVEKFLKMSLDRLNMEYVDLYLIHMPFSFFGSDKDYSPLTNEDGTVQLDAHNDIVATWKVMEEQVEKGLVKSIGLSNFNSEQIERIYKSAKIKPAVLQVELHAYHQQKDLVKRCKELNIAVTAYSPLGSPGANQHFQSKYNYSVSDFPDLLGHSDVKRLAEKYDKTPGQILLKHLVQHDIVVIPKSGNPDRIKANLDIFDFDLSDEDLKRVDALDKGEAGKIFDFLFFKGVEKHPEYPFKDRVTTV